MASRSMQLLEWIKSQDGAVTSRGARQLLGWSRNHVNACMNNLHRCGFIMVKDAAGKHPTYVLTGKEPRPLMTAEQRKEKQRGYARKYQGRLRREAGKPERPRLTEADRLAAMVKKQADHNAKRRAAVSVSKQVRSTSVAQASVRPLRHDPPKPAEVVPETVEQFIARGGQVQSLATSWQQPTRYGRYGGEGALW